ncbi:hypothetical protein CYMTET_29776 [Cymbomonas tetramitiformis]|uniref:C3H1-type domain-containing protein n=1 Tax=Cymbomonas tetramitiformis TaxID=36881 RepID=A0AAE0FKL3_9CHLO|nr:hypothetical protein CYMTET_29776 [Cymbomonas tetramitiformis]
MPGVMLETAIDISGFSDPHHSVKSLEPWREPFPTHPLLSAAASNDLAAARWAIEIEGCALDLFGDWYSPANNSGASEGLERKRRTPLMIAAQHGSCDVLKYALLCGADPCLRSEDDGFTALHCAAAGGSAQTAEVIALLLRAGGERDCRDSAGRRAADLLPRAPETPAERLLGKLQQQIASQEAATPSQPHAASELDKNMYQTDEFRMYEFKVRRCSKMHAHDWTECPFTHPGEKARRRDPRRFHYTGNACPDFRKGSCRRGDACEFSHGVFECWLHPSRYRTQLCKDGTSCGRRVCFFAHSPPELRTPSDDQSGSSSPISTQDMAAFSPAPLHEIDDAFASLSMGSAHSQASAAVFPASSAPGPAELLRQPPQVGQAPQSAAHAAMASAPPASGRPLNGLPAPGLSPSAGSYPHRRAPSANGLVANGAPTHGRSPTGHSGNGHHPPANGHHPLLTATPPLPTATTPANGHHPLPTPFTPMPTPTTPMPTPTTPC